MHYLKQKIAEGEHQQQDFKYQITDSRKIARTLSAFANTDGGRLLIGVKDNGSIWGSRSNEELHMIEGAASLYCQPEIEVTYQNHEVDGKMVLEAIVQPSLKRPHFVLEKDTKPVAYFRRDDENFPASGVLIKYWKHPKMEGTLISFLEREKTLLSFLESHPFITVKRLATMAKISFAKAEDLLATFLYWDVISWRYNGKFFEFYLKNDALKK